MKILPKLKIFGFDKGDKKTLSTWHFKNLSRPALIPWIDFTNFTHEFFFCLKFVSQTFTIHRTAGEGEGYLFNFSHGTKMVRFDWKLKKIRKHSTFNLTKKGLHYHDKVLFSNFYDPHIFIPHCLISALLISQSSFLHFP